MTSVAPIPRPPGPAGEEQLIRLPVLMFLFTLDQVALMMNISLSDFKSKHCYFHLRNTGMKLKHQMMAHNIAPDNETPDWRISHEEFRRWLSVNGFKVQYGHAH